MDPAVGGCAPALAPEVDTGLQQGSGAPLGEARSEVVLFEVPPEGVSSHWILPQELPATAPRQPLEQPHKVALDFTPVACGATSRDPAHHLDWQGADLAAVGSDGSRGPSEDKKGKNRRGRGRREWKGMTPHEAELV